MDWTLNNQALKNVFDIITLGEMMVLMAMYFGARHPRRILPEIGACFFVGVLLLPQVMNRFRILDFYLLFIFLMVFTSLCALLFLKGKWTYKLVVCLFFCVTYLQLHTAELVLWTMLLPEQSFSRIGLTQLDMCLVLLSNRRLGVWHSDDTPPVYIFTLFLSSLTALFICLIVLPALVPHHRYNIATLILCMGTLSLNMTAFYQGQQLMRAYTEKMNLRAVSDRIHADKHLVAETTYLIDELRTQRHERANQALVIRALCDAGDLPGMRAYVDQMFPEEIKDDPIECGHVIVNAVLGQKLRRYERSGIPLTINVHLPPRLPIRDADLCSLVANLLDNALEGSLNEEQPSAYIHMACVKNYMNITVKNHVSHDVLAENPQLFTTKANPSDHGVGIRVIRKIVECYDGMLDFSMQGEWFVANVMLKLNAPEEA